MRNPESLWFGHKAVSPDEKTALVRGVFDSVADRYDLMNDLMSFGVHRLWKDRFVRLIGPRPGWTMVDVAGGTGDIAFRLHQAVKGDGRIIVCDLNAEMVRVGRDRALDLGILERQGIEWTVGNAESLPLPDSSCELYTIAFGLRNVTRIDTGLAEAFRVLKPGGRFACLEFSQVQDPLLDRAYQIFSDQVIPRLGQFVASDKGSYEYLIESIRKFPTPSQLSARLKTVGFDAVRSIPLSGGIAAIHLADKY